MREIRTLRVMRRELETGARGHLRPTAPVPDPTPSQIVYSISVAKGLNYRRSLENLHVQTLE